MISNKDDAYECFNLACKYMKNGNFSHAKNLFLKAKRMFPDIDITEKLKTCEEEINKSEHIGTEKTTYNNNTTTSTFNRDTTNNVHERFRKKDECLEKILRTNNYYEILGIPKNSNDEAIRGAYKKLAKLYHPDKNKDKGAEEAFKKVSKAFQHLINKEKRYEYDNNIDEHGQHTTYRTTHYYYNDDTFTPEDLFRNFFGLNFATCNNTNFRTHINSNRSYSNNNNTNSANNAQRNYSFVQILIFLIMFLIFFLSSHFEQPKAVYSLQKTNYFDTINYTSLNNIRFYTKRTFNYNYPRNSHSRFQVINFYVQIYIYIYIYVSFVYIYIYIYYIYIYMFYLFSFSEQKINYKDIPESCMKLKTLEVS
ncbi:hypothetical protein PFMALIP_03435 [Plasmodium falciparum MaliPS096_E11]|uniref:J domain-containing protein n=1 Tax=Plasmodium falciparum MaliPS096_E11 TaxID=1036727 RepID=A0A024WPM7_PLAFA|nr:hypothetical protein PFMALIP_03435 [Plasmodium falciparum MaliPS096_E11]